MIKKKMYGWKKNEKRETAIISYQKIMSVAETWVDMSSYDDSVLLLDYLIDTIIDDICSSYISATIYKSYGQPINPPYPVEYRDNNGKTIKLLTQKVLLHLSDTRLIVTPWSLERTYKKLIELHRKPFRQDSNHQCFYYRELNLCFVGNGFHTINAGRYYKKGTIEASEYRLIELFPHFDTNGIYWYHTYNKKSYSKVGDFRFSALFSLAKMKHELINKKPKGVL